MKASVHTQDHILWLKKKSKCPACNAKDMCVVSGHDFVKLVAYLKCYKCDHVWDVVPLIS